MSAAVCPNIGPRERRRRLIGGVVFLLVTVAVAAALIVFDAPRPWRLLVFLPAWAAAIGFYQASARTCVALAARGLKNMDAGDEAVTDAGELEQMRAQSRAVHIRAAVTALAAALLLLLLPARAL